MKRTTSKLGSALIVAVTLLVPTVGQAIDRTVNCTDQTITSVLRSLSTGDTLKVIGACSENVTFTESRHNIVLDGQGTATISGPDTTSATILIRGRRITIQNFASITGGSNGIQVSRGGTALISGNTIQNVGTNGIVVNQQGEATIINNTIQNNANGSGIVVTEHSSARIGISATGDTVASPNTITNNGTASGDNGIVVTRSSFATIEGHTVPIVGTALITSNGCATCGSGGTASGSGILVTRGSAADISSNTISDNAQDGISVNLQSFVRLGNDTGTDLDSTPNSGTGNGRNGIRCRLNSSADGRQGTITGTAGAVDFSADCVNSLIP